MNYQLQIVKHPASGAVLPYTYPEAHPEAEAARRLDAFNALPGFRARLVDAPIPAQLCGVHGCVFLPHPCGPHSWAENAQ